MLLTLVPLGLVGLGIVSDLLYLSTGQPWFAQIAYWNLSGIVVAGAVAAAFGAWSYGCRSSETRVDTLETWPGLPGIVVIALFGASWVLRRQDAALLPGVPALSASFCAAIVAIFAGGLRSDFARGMKSPRVEDPGQVRHPENRLAH
jgi:uncharacterized membrane protein